MYDVAICAARAVYSWKAKTCVWLNMYVCVFSYVNVCVHRCMYVYEFVCMCMHVCICISWMYTLMLDMHAKTQFVALSVTHV